MTVVKQRRSLKVPADSVAMSRQQRGFIDATADLGLAGVASSSGVLKFTSNRYRQLRT